MATKPNATPASLSIGQIYVRLLSLVMSSVRYVSMASRSTSKLWRYWGYIVLVVLIVSLSTKGFGPGVYAFLVGLLIFYVLFQAPVWCGAVNRKRSREIEYCRNNSSGLLLGCNQVRQHKWQKLQGLWWTSRWRENTHGLWAGPAAKFATISGLVGIVTGIWGVIK
jgi:hypothetical protein